jgi:hypothetical protein
MPIHDVIPLYPGGNSEHSGDPILRLPGGPLSCYQIQRQITRLQAGFLSSRPTQSCFHALAFLSMTHQTLHGMRPLSFKHLPNLAFAIVVDLQTPTKPCLTLRV